jgi:invasion protein IalB
MAHARKYNFSSLSAFAAALAIAGTPAFAQDKPAAAPAKPAAAAPAPAAAGAAAPAAAAAPASAAAAAANKSAWVKLCEKTPLMKKGEDGKEVKDEKDICLTHHERLDGNSGMVLVSAAIREVEGQDKKHLMVMVPLGMALPPGLRAAVYTKDQWAKIAKNEKVDDKELKPIDLKYSLCHASGCTAEIEADAGIIDQMKVGGGIMIVAMNAAAQPIGFPVPLDGFTEAYAGKPIDNAEYKKARGQLMAQIRERQKAAIDKFKADQLKKIPTDGPGAPPTTTGSAPPKPADKK